MPSSQEFPENSENDLKDDLYEHHRIKVDKGQEPLRIDKFLINRLEAVSRTKVQQAALAESILVNNVPVKSSYKVRPNDLISIVFSSPVREYSLEPEDIPLDIFYEDAQVIVLNKQAGLVVHPGSGNYTGTLVNALLYHIQKLPPSEDESRPGLVHRLDKNTTGLMVVAKTEFAMNHLAKQFFKRTVKRKYIALVWGDLQQDDGIIEGNIGRNLRYRKKMDVFPEGDYGKTAVTHYKVIERFGYVTLVECRLETGRTHQIRIHMNYIGHPLFNDDTYGGDRIVKGTIYTKYKQFIENCFKVMPRQALHAGMLGFIHPDTKEELLFECPLPEDFHQLIEKWRNYFNYSLINK